VGDGLRVASYVPDPALPGIQADHLGAILASPGFKDAQKVFDRIRRRGGLVL
jgi:hypothetical protein